MVYVPFSVVTLVWHGEHHAFVMEEYLHNCDSMINTQLGFCIRFGLDRHDFVPDKKTIQIQVGIKV